jgi:hypothetical protein
LPASSASAAACRPAAQGDEARPLGVVEEAGDDRRGALVARCGGHRHVDGAVRRHEVVDRGGVIEVERGPGECA